MRSHTLDTKSETPIDIQAVRKDFPILDQEVHGKPLVYLDNAATKHRPLPVLDAIRHFETHDHSNVHRGVHALSVRATAKFDEARTTVRRFLNAECDEEILFTKGCTEAINLVARSWGSSNLKTGDRVLLSMLPKSVAERLMLDGP